MPQYTKIPMRVGTRAILTLSDPHFILGQSNCAENSSPTFLKHHLSLLPLNTQPALQGRFPSQSSGLFANFLYISGLKVSFRQMSSLATKNVIIPGVKMWCPTQILSFRIKAFPYLFRMCVASYNSQFSPSPRTALGQRKLFPMLYVPTSR